mgnify:FL=1
MKENALKLFATACVLTVGITLFACSPQQPATDADQAAGGTAEEQVDVAAETGQYQSDEQCLSCHGGSYESLAATTAGYGLSNPHNSIHGGYNSCVNCHARDKEVTDNQCDNCHAWPHNPTSGPGASL